MTSPTSPDAPTRCPNPACGKPAAGRFCAECGASLTGAPCTGCDATLSPGARFCHRCGTAAGASVRPLAGAPKDGAGALPWAVAAIALLALVALVAGQQFRRGRPAEAASNGAPTPGSSMGSAPTGMTGPRAPDISQMTPEQRAERLYDRMMTLAEQGKRDSVQLFAPMAVAAYEMLDSLNLDQRYDLGRLGEIAGNQVLAKAQADTILRRDPNHLLGHLLAARAARMRGDTAAERDHLRRFAAAEPAERVRALPEYLLHQSDIKAALADAGALKP